MESVRTEYTIRYNVHKAETWLHNSNVVTDNLHWTTDLKKVQRELKRTKKEYSEVLKDIDLETEERGYIKDMKCYIESAHIICRQVYYSEPIPYVEGTITQVGGR